MSPFSSLLWILGLILSFSLLSNTQNFNTFMEKHIVSDKANINCNVTIRERNLRDKNNCRWRNTFIHDTNGKRVKDLCSGIIPSTIMSLKESLPLTDCRLMKGSPKPPQCAYNQTSAFGIVYITCENNYPVHFVKYEASLCSSSFPSALNLVAVILLGQILLFAYY